MVMLLSGELKVISHLEQSLLWSRLGSQYNDNIPQLEVNCLLQS